ncbi:MAG: GAF domain-containing sensor histidine kinase, partial [Flavobacteriales bacterium]|nr:GAF domain-containing sensor histidine kinase [Flavobacteriales bacterium]
LYMTPVEAIDKLEKDRLNAQSRYNIIDSFPEAEYDEIVRLAAYITQTPVSHISFLTEDRNWFKAKVGVDITETPREVSFCQHAIPSTELFFEIPNAMEDERFKENPFVANDPNVRFYASVLLRSDDGFNIGTLCVLDLKPRQLDEQQKAALLSLGRMVSRLLELRKTNADMNFQSANLKVSNEHLEKFASVVSHDLRSPLTAIKFSATMLQSEDDLKENSFVQEMTEITLRKCDEQERMIKNILAFSRTNQVCVDDIKSTTLKKVIAEVLEEIENKNSVNVTLVNEDQKIVTDVISLHRIFLNFFTNSVKHSDKDEVAIAVSCVKEDTTYQFEISDNGPGIPAAMQPRLFELNFVAKSGQNNLENSHGIGMYAVKSIIERLGGEIELVHNDDPGASFRFRIEDLSNLKN